MLGILGALDPEIQLVRGVLDDAATSRLLGTDVTIGDLTVRGRSSEVAVARCGVGKVNAALAAAALALAGVTHAVFTGVAGALDPQLRIGDIVVATDLVQHDVDVTALGHPAGQLLGEPFSWTCDARLADKLAAAAEVVAAGRRSVMRGRIASGDQFIAGPERAAAIRSTFGALCAEMEGAAFAQACHELGLPCAVVRIMSDTADDQAPTDFPAFLGESSRLGLALAEELVATWT